MDANPAVKLVKAWDDIATFRDKMRTYNRMLVLPAGAGGVVAPEAGHVIPKSIQVARCNMDTMYPIFKLMSGEVGLKMPIIDMVLEAATSVYDKYKVEPDTSKIYQDGWGIRRLAQLVKARLYKKHPPQEHMLKLAMCCGQLSGVVLYCMQVIYAALLQISPATTRMLRSSRCCRSCWPAARRHRLSWDGGFGRLYRGPG